MSRAPRFVCTDPDAGDLEFADVDEVLDALEAALVQPGTALFDVARQSRQPLGLHPEIRAAWEDRLRYQPATPGLGLPPLPSMTALVRSLPGDDDVLERRRQAFARIRAGTLPSLPAGPPRGDRSRRYAAIGLAWALVLLGVVGWAIVTFASRLSSFAAGVMSFRPR
jgi:hypothetical protein